MKILFVVAVLVLGLTLWPLGAGIVYNSVDPFIIDLVPGSDPVSGQCPDAPSHIIGAGKGLTLIRTTTSADGMLHMGITFNGTGKAIDANGGKWVLNDGDNFLSLNAFPGPDGSYEATATESFHLISQGSAKDITIHGVMHVKVLANGTVAVNLERDRGASEFCEGIFAP